MRNCGKTIVDQRIYFEIMKGVKFWVLKIKECYFISHSDIHDV